MSQKLLEEAESVQKTSPQRAEQLYREILQQPAGGKLLCYFKGRP
jgi:hypothetical protein